MKDEKRILQTEQLCYGNASDKLCAWKGGSLYVITPCTVVWRTSWDMENKFHCSSRTTRK